MLRVLTTCLVLFHFSLAELPLPSVRIAGGSQVDILEYPYQVGIEERGYYKCGGAIISRIWILSAASCVYELPIEDLRVRSGTSYSSIGGELYNISTVIPHDSYTSASNDSDIALLQLEKPIALSVSAQIVNLVDNKEAIIEGTRGTIAGWGPKSEGVYEVGILQAVEISVKSQSVCRDVYDSYEITDRMFCANSLSGTKDACTLDRGGPLVSNYKVIGIFSWGLKCGTGYWNSGVYTNVGVFRDWITEHTGI